MDSSFIADRAPRAIAGVTAARLRLDVAIALGAGLWIATAAYFVGRAERIVLGDWITYWEGARRLAAGEPLYAPFQLLGRFGLGAAAFGTGYVYPPTAAVLTLPLALVGLLTSWVVWLAVGTGLLALVTYRIAIAEGVSRRIAAAVTALVVLSGPALEALLTGNVNALAAVGVGLVWLAPRTTGYVAVIGGLIKLYPFGGLAWAIRKRLDLRGPLTFALVVSVTSLAFVGFGGWSDFTTVLRNGVPSGDFMLVSPRLLLQEFFGSTLAFAMVLGISAALLVVVIRGHRERRDFFILSLAMIVPATDWYLHYLVVPLVGALPAICHAIASARTHDG